MPRKPSPSTRGVSLESPARVFISYRRDDTGPAAAHLHSSLARELGAEKIFRDIDTIQPGQNFETVIRQAIAGTSVCLVLIGRSWLTIQGENGRRLDEQGDYVRGEIEAALKAGVEIIPLLVDGAQMPSRKELPPSIADLAVRNAYELPWDSAIKKLGSRIGQIERDLEERAAAERVERQRLDLTAGKRIAPGNFAAQSALGSFAVVVRAMELSLARQGHKVWLSGPDLVRSYNTRRKDAETMGFQVAELFHLIDFVGVKERKGSQRYVARSYPLGSFDEVPAQLALGRPVIATVMVQESWYKEPILKSGFVELEPKQQLVGGVLVAIIGWDPIAQQAKALFPWSTWGNAGIGTMTRPAIDAYVDKLDLRSIEPVLLPKSPFNAQ